METFTSPKEFTADPRYHKNRQNILKTLDLRAIDPPVAELIEGFALLPQCFTLQCCYGHFLCHPGQDTHNLERLPDRFEGKVTYRIAYMAFCLENSQQGRKLRESLEHVQLLDPDYVQFGCADWFWERYCNSYILQVEPVRHRRKDQIVIDHQEALHIEKIRDLFFIRLKEILEMCPGRNGSG
ncbi:MAG: hypothetical protein JXM72_04430 [Deltaproteobacteria bacterium]|nr:hypothetical protein [Deltaproteobacteria bacterium]